VLRRVASPKLHGGDRDPSHARDFGKEALIFLTSLTSRKNPDYYARSMQASRFSFAFTYRYFFTGSGEADGVLNMLK